MNSQTILQNIAAFRAVNNGAVPAAMIINNDNIVCMRLNEVLASNEPSIQLCIQVNYTNTPEIYSNDIPVLLDGFENLSIKDYMYRLMEAETRP